MEFYTYAYLREDGRPYYIGKGKGGRMFANHKHVNLPPNENNIIKLKTNLSEEEAMRHEIYLISVLGRKDLGTGILINLTDGGEGSSGRETSEITKQKLREAGRRRSHSDETRRKMSESQKKAAKTEGGERSQIQGWEHYW